MNEVICNFCQKPTRVFTADKGIHACMEPACQRDYEKETQFANPSPTPQGKEVDDTTVGFPPLESEKPLVPP